MTIEHSASAYPNHNVNDAKMIVKEDEQKQLKQDFAAFDQNTLEKIGFALRCYHAMSDFSVVPFERDEYEVYFGLACLTAGAFGKDRQSDIKDAVSLVNGCIQICCGKE